MRSSPTHLSAFLPEIERHDGLMIMATNRPQDLDDAMQRRISMVFEFPKPDHLQRVEIWKSQLPSQVGHSLLYDYYSAAVIIMVVVF